MRFIKDQMNIKDKKIIQTQKGITLIALAITIIVLLILAGVTIGAITGEDGIIKNALEAREKTEIANEKEIVEEAALNAMKNNKRGNIVRDELQEELDKITGEGKTIVTEDTEGQGYFVKFVSSQRIYKVSLDGDVTYLGEEKELISQAEVIANPESNETPQLVQQVELTVQTPIEIEGAEYSLVYTWNQDKDNAPEDSKFMETTLTGTGRIRKTTVSSIDTVGGNYYLWIRVVVGKIEKTQCFGPYAIKDHTTLVRVEWADSMSESGFLGNSEVPRGKIQNINIVKSLEGHNINDANTWDVSQSGNGTYLAWYKVNENGYYDVTIGGKDGVVANSSSSNLFRYIGFGIKDQEVTINGLENLDTGLVTGGMSYMFQNCLVRRLDLKGFDTSGVTSMAYMFEGCNNLTELDLSNFNTSNVINMINMFHSCSSLLSLDVSSFDTRKVTNMQWMFSGCSITRLELSNFDTSNVTDMSNMFSSCSATSIDTSSFNTSNVIKMNSMFANTLVTNLNLNNFNTSNVTDMSSMFSGCSAARIEVSNFNTNNVTNMQMMFMQCKSTGLDLSSFNTSKVTNMFRMFMWCRNLTSLDVSSFDTSNVVNMNNMFRECTSLTKLDVSSFKTPKVDDMEYIFAFCSNLKELDYSNFEPKEGTNIGSMFYYCTSLEKLDIRKFDIANTTGYNEFWMSNVPKTCNIIVKDTMKQWFTENYPSYTNVTIEN